MENGVVVTAVQADVEMSIPHSTSNSSSTSTTRNRPASKPSAIASPPSLVDFYESWEFPRSERSVRAPRGPTATTTTTTTPTTTSTLSSTNNSTSSPFVASEFSYFVHSSSDGSRDDVLAMDDGLDFFDESFFFLDHIEHSGPASSSSSSTRKTTFLFPTDRNCGNPSSFYSYSRRRSGGGSNRGNQQRVYFGSRLKECQMHRMSTIAETTANNEDMATDPILESPASSSDAHATTVRGTPPRSVKPRERRVSSRDPIYPFPTRVHKVSTTSRPHPALPAPKVGVRKILDYILPYPSHSLSTRSPTTTTSSSQTQQARRKRKRRVSTMSVTSQKTQDSRPQERLPMDKTKGKSIVAADGTVIPRTALITLHANTAGSSSSSEESSLDEEGWIVHGFFEIQKAL